VKVAIYTRGIELAYKSYFKELISTLQKNDIKIICHKLLSTSTNYIEELNGLRFFKDAHEIDSDVSFFITLGGDGTILDAVTYIAEKEIPVIGINFGRLGFLATTAKESIQELVQCMLQHSYTIEKRTLLHIDSSNPVFSTAPFALNECTIHKTDISPMIKIHTYINGEFLNTYWSDGLIVSTPTGSTGYNLSCNGPIIFPHNNAFAITPVSPHNLNNRPIVVPDDTVVTFEVEGRADQYLCTLDARREVIHMNTKIAIRKEKFPFHLLQMPENNFLNTLRNKLGWGLDIRN
jgi:NAD+ kinase